MDELLKSIKYRMFVLSIIFSLSVFHPMKIEVCACIICWYDYGIDGQSYIVYAALGIRWGQASARCFRTPDLSVMLSFLILCL